MDDLKATLKQFSESVTASLERLHEDVGRSAEQTQSLGKRIERVEAILSDQPKTARQSPALPELSLFVETRNSERKPFVFRLSGIAAGSFRASSVRAAILLVLLADLDERLDGRSGIQNRQAAIKTAFSSLTGDDSSKAAESVRVAIYRFKEFFHDAKISTTEGYELRYDPTALQLNIYRGGSALTAGEAVVNLTSNESSVSTVLERIIKTSVLRRLGKRGALFVPPGPSGYDKLLVEVFEQDCPICAITTYFRPSSVSFPRGMLERMGSSETILRRWDIAHKSYEAGSFYYLEILNFSTIWDFIRRNDEGRFLLYPKVVGPDDIERHIEFMIDKVERIKTYELVLSNALFPFYLGLFELKSEPLPRSLTLFFRQNAASEPIHDISCLVLSDQAVFQNMNERVINWVLNHPSTIRSKNEVSSELQKVLSHFRAHGALSLTQPAPD